MTGIEDLVKSLPSGYDTQIGAGGVSLSAGQRQRIGLARALYGAPFLIVLDEPNSNLDTDGEEALKQAILTMREANKIVIVIAHRPSAIAAVNFLIYLKDGKAQMFGPKDEVLQKVSPRHRSMLSQLSERQAMSNTLSQTGLEARAVQSLKRSLGAAFFAIALLLGGVGGWAAATNISGAVLAQGMVIVETNVKTVKHREGGTVKAIHVREGQRVEAGDVLVELDDVVLKAELAIIIKRYNELRAQETRLLAERDGAEAPLWPEELEESARISEAAARIVKGQANLFAARAVSLGSRRRQLSDQISQIEQQIAGFEFQRKAKQVGLELVASEIVDFERLKASGLVTDSQVNARRRERANLQGEIGDLTSRIAQAREAIAERRIQIVQQSDQFREQVLVELHKTRAEMSQLSEQKVAAEDRLSDTVIRSPRDGHVHQLEVHTVGGVVTPGEPMMSIVPREDVLAFEVRVDPADADQVAPGQAAVLRFSAFDQRATPELNAAVKWLSANVSVDPATQLSFYTVRLELSEGERGRLGDTTLVPGMPLEAHIQTGYRTVLSYLTKPLSDQIARTFREN